MAMHHGMKRKASSSPALVVLVAVLLLSSAVSRQQAPQPGKQTAANNLRLQRAYVVLRALKRAITDDPKNLTRGWCGPDVCAYFGVFCAAAPDDPHTLTVACHNLNHGDLAGTFPKELGMLSDLVLLHLTPIALPTEIGRPPVLCRLRAPAPYAASLAASCCRPHKPTQTGRGGAGW